MKEKLFIPPEPKQITLLADEPQAFKRILLMEDDPRAASNMKDYLESRHFDVFIAKSAVAALREIMDEDFDLIICNTFKPVFAYKMFHIALGKVNPQLLNRMIFITGRNVDPAAHDFIRKVNGVALWMPFPLHVLLETVELALSKNARRRAGAPSTAVPLAPAPAKNEVGVRKSRENQQLVYLSLSAAKTSIKVLSSCFQADLATVELLLRAREKTVAVELIVPAAQSPKTMKPATASWNRLIDSGVEIYECHNPIETGRVIICDEQWTCLSRSNFEASNLNVYHGEFTQRCLRTFEELKSISTKLERIWNSEPQEPAPVVVEKPNKSLLSSLKNNLPTFSELFS